MLEIVCDTLNSIQCSIEAKIKKMCTVLQQY